MRSENGARSYKWCPLQGQILYGEKPSFVRCSSLPQNPRLAAFLYLSIYLSPTSRASRRPLNFLRVYICRFGSA